MGAVAGLTLASGAAAGLGAALGPDAPSTGVDTSALLNQYDKVLNQALGNAINTSTGYTNQAINQQNQSLGQANAITGAASTNAQQADLGTTNAAFNLGQGLISPYTNSGYQANDAYMQSLGLSTPAGGSQAQANSTAYNQAVGLLNQQYGGQAPTNPGSTAPAAFTPGTAPTLSNDPATAAQVQAYIQANTHNAAGQQYYNGQFGNANGIKAAGNIDAYVQSNPALMQSIATQLGQQQDQSQYQSQLSAFNSQQTQAQAAATQAQQQYQQGLTSYTQYQSQLANLQQIYPQANVGANGQATPNTSGAGAQPASSANQGLSNFLNSANYQSLFGTGQATNVANGGQYDPMAGFNQTAPTQQQFQTSAAPAQNTGLGSFLNSSQYQSLFGTQAGQQFAQNGTYNPVQAFEQNPGTQFAINQGLQSLQEQGAAKGSLNSGAMQNELAAYAVGTENQNYNNYLGQIGNANTAYTGDYNQQIQNQNAMNTNYNTAQANYNAAQNAYMGQIGGAFTGYQSNLAGLTSLGSQLTGANTAASLYGNVANNQNSDIYGTGSQQSAATQATGANISGLQANQGVLDANAQLNTGAAQANELNQMAALSAQQNAQQQASQAQTQSAALNNQGYGQAAGMFGYNANTGTSASTGLFNNTAQSYGQSANQNNGGHF